MAPQEPVSQYRHNDTGEDNADAHIKRQIMGREVVVAMTEGRLDFGTWEQIFYGEFDGRRRKRAIAEFFCHGAAMQRRKTGHEQMLRYTLTNRDDRNGSESPLGASLRVQAG